MLAAQLEREPSRYEALLHRLRVGETDFFREPAHFDLLREVVVSAWRADPEGRTLQVWSAGCATGEEPYSVAITLDELGVLDRARILGTDLSEEALHGARRSSYSAWSLRRCDEEQRRTWFRARRGGASTSVIATRACTSGGRTTWSTVHPPGASTWSSVATC